MSSHSKRAACDASTFANVLQRGAMLDDPTLLDVMVWRVMVGDESVTMVID